MYARFDAVGSFSDRACFFCCSSMSSSFRTCGFRRHLHEDIQSDGQARKWNKGFAVFSSIFSCSVVLRCSISVVQSQPAKDGKLEPRPTVLSTRIMYSKKVCQSAGDWRQCNDWEPLCHSMSCAALGLEVSCDRNWNQRTYICRRRQD